MDDEIDVEIKSIDTETGRVTLRLPSESGRVHFEDFVVSDRFWGKVSGISNSTS